MIDGDAWFFVIRLHFVTLLPPTVRPSPLRLQMAVVGNTRNQNHNSNRASRVDLLDVSQTLCASFIPPRNRGRRPDSPLGTLNIMSGMNHLARLEHFEPDILPRMDIIATPHRPDSRFATGKCLALGSLRGMLTFQGPHGYGFYT